MQIKENTPYAPNLVESMRSLGYSFSTAIADIIDNSIAANATQIDIFSIIEKENPFIAIIDNGSGMSNNELFKAMQYGSINPNIERNKNDMGRFGLGLKSASLSQCRKLTVLSKKNNTINALCWDVDYIIECGKWYIKEFTQKEIDDFPHINLLKNKNSGTMVVWENFDRIKITTNDINETIKKLLVNSIDHLSLIYHRLIGPNLKITINNLQIKPRDPFLQTNSNTQPKREQYINIDNKQIIVKPFILPHINKLSHDDIVKLGGKDSLRTEQGFYIYRNKRLIIWGTWFRLGYKNELTKLARVRVDIPNDLDYIWDIDIKKSKATIPEKIKTKLYNVVIETCDVSEKVHEYRGRKVLDNNFSHTWNIIQKKKNEGLKLEINMDEPRINYFFNTLDEEQKKVFVNIIQNIEKNIPLDYIYTEIAKGQKTSKNSVENREKILENIKKELNNFKTLGMSKNAFINALLVHDEFVNDKYLIQEIKKLKE